MAGGPIADSLGPVVVTAYIILMFQPFSLLVNIPGSAASVVLPAFGVGVLSLTPADRLRRIPISLPLAALLAWLGLSYLWSELPGYTLFLVRAELVPLVILAAVAGTMNPRRVIATILAVTLGVAAWSVLTSLLLAEGRIAQIDGVDQFGFRGTFIHKNLLGAFAVYGLCAALVFTRGRRRLLCLGIFLAAILGSRSATTAAGLLGVIFAWGWMAAIERQRTRRERQFLFTLSVASALAALLIGLGLLPAFLGLYDKDVTFSGRTDIWAASLVAINDQPILGYGLGGVWSDPSAPTTAKLHHMITFNAAHSHNAIVELILEAGVVGFALALLLITQTVRLAAGCFVRSETTAFGQWAVLTLIAMAIMGLAEPFLEGPHLGILALIWVVLARLRWEQRTAPRRDLPRTL